MKLSDYKIYETTDYSQFKTLEGNRVLTNDRVNKIVESINKVGYLLSPILVNEKMEVIDGQGRLGALERLKLPVHYMVHEGIGVKECQQMNIHQSNWTLYDYIMSYAMLGDENYKRLQSLVDKYRELPIDVVITSATGNLNNGGANTTKKVKNGKVIVTDKDYERARWELDYCEKVRQVAKTIGGAKRPFYLAVIYAYKSLSSDGRNLMETVIRQHAYDFPSLTKPVEYLKHLDGYYNKEVTKSKRIKLAIQWEIDTM